jgi:flagellar hook-length control protein FliK
LNPASAKQAALNRLTSSAPAIKQSVVQHAFIPQAAKGLAMALKQGEGTVTINLKPAHLGSLRVEITMQGSDVTAKLEASSETARQLLIDAQPSLRAALEARGLSVERIDITAAPPSAPSQDAADHGPDLGRHQGGENPDRQTGSGAEAHTGQGRGHSRGGDIETAADPWPAPPVEVSFTLGQGGVYRLRLDAIA